jgi:hypothetical protein
MKKTTVFQRGFDAREKVRRGASRLWRMTLFLDSSGLLAAIDAGQEDYVAAREVLESARGPC